MRKAWWTAVGIGALLSVFGPFTSAHGEWGFKTRGSTLPPPQLQPESDEILRTLAQAEGLLRMGNPVAAADLCRKLPLSGLHRPAIVRVLAWALHDANSPARLLHIVGEAPHKPEMQFLQAEALRKTGSEIEAREILRRLWWDQPNGFWGLASLRSLVTIESAPYSPLERQLVETWVAPATSARALREPAADTTTLSEIAQRAPWRSTLAAEVRHALGFRLLKNEEFTLAAAELKRALKQSREPELTRVIELRLGEAYRLQGSFTRALKHFDRVAQSNDDSFAQEALAMAGEMCIQYRRYSEAQQRFQEQLVRNPVGPARQTALWGLGWVAFRTGNFPVAEKFLRSLHRENPYGPLAARSLYWRARTLYELGNPADASAVLRALTQRFPIDYYTYRANAWLKQYGEGDAIAELDLAPYPPALKEIQSLVDADMPARAKRALKDIDFTYDVLGPAAWNKLEALAGSVKRPQQAKTFRWNRIKRFPGDLTDYKKLQRLYPQTYVQPLRKLSKQNRVPADLVTALVRQESAYNARAVSATGALGLMQLMPATATELMRENKSRYRFQSEDILKPETNMKLGTRYIGRMYRSFGKRAEYALAAYNAGPGAVTRWRQARGDLPVDIFAEEIPYRETRQYVKRVLGHVQTLRAIRTARAPKPQKVALQ